MINPSWPQFNHTYKMIMHNITVLKSSQAGFIEMTMSSTYVNGFPILKSGCEVSCRPKDLNRPQDLIEVLSMKCSKVIQWGLITWELGKDIDLIHFYSAVLKLLRKVLHLRTSCLAFPSVTECALMVHWARIEFSVAAWQTQFCRLLM